jgi:hypothetical protein
MRKIHYPIFLSCRDCTKDIFWKGVFENLAYGEPPRGVYFKENTLYSVTKKKEFNYSFYDKTAEKIYQDIHTLLSGLYGLKSKGDLLRRRELFEEFQKINSTRRSEDLWSKIKRKSLKDNLIQDYVLEMKKKYKLGPEQTKKLFFFVSVGCAFKLFSGNEIVLKGGYIKSIEGIDLSDGIVNILRKFEEPPIKKENGKTIYLYRLWENYLKTLE